MSPAGRLFIIIFSFILFFVPRAFSQDKIDLMNQEMDQVMNANFGNERGLMTRDEALKEIKSLEAELTSKKRYIKQLEDRAKEYYVKSKEAEELKRDADSLNLVVKTLRSRNTVLEQRAKDLQKQLVDQKNAFDQEKAKLYEELGGAYVKAKMLDLAIDVYEKCLAIQPENGQVHYNIALLYKRSREERDKASHHLKIYISLEKNNKKRQEARYLLDMIQQDLY